MAAPLSGVRVVELGGLGPAPYGTMLLADLGADVIRVDRPVSSRGDNLAHLMSGVWRGRRSVALDLKTDMGLDVVRALCREADVLIDPFRPGVLERLGLAPADLQGENPGLIVARMTGFGQSGPMAQRAGHDINFLAVTGVLHTLGRPDSPPPPPVGYIGDFGGGGTFLALGVAAALIERSRSGMGQVLDVAVVDGAASLSAYVHGLIDVGEWSLERGSNLSDGGCPFYDCYSTADERYVAVGALEPQFFVNLLTGLGMEPAEWAQYDRTLWPDLRSEIARRFRMHTMHHWERVFENVDACVTPVLRHDEAPNYEHNRERGTYVGSGLSWRPRAVPRFSRTDPVVDPETTYPGSHTDQILDALTRTGVGFGTSNVADSKS